MAALAPGQQLGHRFRLFRPLGEGGMGEAWLVDDLELEERVVIKLLRSDAPPEWMALLKQECRQARGLVHPNIVRVYDLHEENGLRFISMAYVDGRDIGRLRGRPLSEILAAALRVADALEYAHRQGVIHRDLESRNVLLDGMGEPHVVDFGLAGLLEAGGGDPPVGETREPTVSDDILAFGALLYDLLSDRSEPLPKSLTSLLTSVLTTDGAGRFQTMSEVKEAIEAIQRERDVSSSRSARPEKGPVKLAPPPRVRRGESLHPRAMEAASKGPRHEPSSAVGWATVATFAFLAGAMAAVFFWLPRWAPVPGQANPAPAVEESPRASGALPEESLPESTRSLRQQAALKTDAEELREEVLSLRDRLEHQSAERWGGVLFRSATAAIETGEQQLRERDYAAATGTYQTVLRQFRELLTQSEVILREALAEGHQALEAGDSPTAIAAFELAASIEPQNDAAVTGLARANVANELVRLLAEGAAHESRGDLERARESYRKAVSLDRHAQRARLALARAESKLAGVAFRTAMSQGLAALNEQDYAAARELFQRAGEIRPGDSQVQAGIAQAEEGIRLQAIAAHRRTAARLESEEQWHRAAEEYEAVLKLDPTIRFAQEGKARSEKRASLDDRIQYHVSQRERLSDEEVLATAAALLEEAEQVEPAGPRLRSQRTRLAEVVSEASTPVRVLLESDNETMVVVYRVGVLGRFQSHTLKLRPGTYTVVGSRPGYRDIRLSLHIEAGKDVKPLVVRCEEEI